MLDRITLRVGSSQEVLSTVKDQVFNSCVTSPPYFGLRDYGHKDQIGLEQRAPEYVASLVDAFSDVYRTLRNDGVLFVNIGDTYAGFKDGKFPPQSSSNGSQRDMPLSGAPHRQRKLLELDGFKNKETMGIPWMFAFAMREAGWYIRQEIIWAKSNYTPEKVRDRFIRSHEHIFMFTKRDKYYFDGDAVRVPADGGGTKLRSDVFESPTSSYKGAHFATFPPELIEPLVVASTPPDGVVLDLFAGSGTTGEVAQAHGRNAFLIELNPEFAGLARQRLKIA